MERIKEGKIEFHHNVLKLGGRHYDNLFSKVIAPGGKYFGILIVLRDVTDKVILQRELEKSIKELKLLQEINNALNTSMRLGDTLKIIVDGITGTFGYDYCAVHLLSADRTSLVCKGFAADKKIIRSIEEITGRTALNYKIPLQRDNPILKIIEDKEPLITDDIEGLIKFHTDDKIMKKKAPAIAKIIEVKSGIGVPLSAGDDVVGVVGIGSKNQLTKKDVELLKNFAIPAGLAVEKARLYGNIREKSSELQRVLGEIVPSKQEFDSQESIDSDEVIKAISHPIRRRVLELLDK